MSPLTSKIHQFFWTGAKHPYRRLDESVRSLVKPNDRVLEHGCGRTAPILSGLKDTGAELVGVDLVDFTVFDPDLKLVNADIAKLPFANASFDFVFSRSVMEHVVDPLAVFKETARILNSGGKWVFLTPNKWDYVSIASRLVPNRFHSKIVNKTQGRKEENVFPTVYGANSYKKIDSLCRASGFKLKEISYLGQPPAYLQFNPIVYCLGSIYEKMILATNLTKGVRGWLFVTLQKID
jgi:ubiquinone/menaquinone biosynthesis C-methylase UbiE